MYYGAKGGFCHVKYLWYGFLRVVSANPYLNSTSVLFGIPFTIDWMAFKYPKMVQFPDVYTSWCLVGDTGA